MLVTFDADKTSVYNHQSEPTQKGYTPGWAGGTVPPYTWRKYSPHGSADNSSGDAKEGQCCVRQVAVLAPCVLGSVETTTTAATRNNATLDMPIFASTCRNSWHF